MNNSRFSSAEEVVLAAQAIRSREREALRIFRPMPQQVPFLKSNARIRILRGGNRCLGGEQLIYDPVLNTERRVDEIREDFHVLSRNPSTGLLEIKRACKPFVKAFGALYKITLSNGQNLISTLEHRVLDAHGRWISIAAAWKHQVPLLCEMEPDASRASVSVRRTWVAKPSNVQRPVAHRAIFVCSGYSSGLSGEFSAIAAGVSEGEGWNRLQSGSSAGSGKDVPDERLPGHFLSCHPLLFAVPERCGHCVVSEVQPLGNGWIYDITVDDFSNYSAASLTNANSGKTLTSFALTASCATGMPIHLSETETLKYQFPSYRPKRIWICGKGVAHIGQTIYRMLFTDDNGLKIIRDERTNKWRAWNPNSEYDKAYSEKCRFADPFIPKRFVKSIAWEHRAIRHFNHVELIDGSMIYAFSSSADARQGDAVDLIHIDEDIDYPEHVMEWFMRLADYKGRMFWSAYPHSDNNALRDFHQMALEESGKADPIAEEFVLRFDENEYIDKDTRDQQLQVLLYAGEAKYRARNLGEFTFDTSLVYPTFHVKCHTALQSEESRRDKVDQVLRETGGEPPNDWTRYFVIDPGKGTCAGLFLAVPPPEEFGDYVIAYDEIYQKQSHAYKMAEACAAKMSGHVFHDFIMDWHGGRITPMGFTKTVEMNYREAFQSFGLRCTRRGTNFAWGSDNLSGGIEQVRGWLALNKDGYPKLRLVTSRVPHLIKEFGLYKQRIRNDDLSDEPIPQWNHLLDCLRYAAAANISYVKPRRGGLNLNPAYRAFMKEKQQETSRRRLGGDYINLGPGAVV